MKNLKSMAYKKVNISDGKKVVSMANKQSTTNSTSPRRRPDVRATKCGGAGFAMVMVIRRSCRVIHQNYEKYSLFQK
jgi:hypothetical protein